MTTVEHALPIPVLYDDVLTLYALSGTGATPTHIVNYGGAWGEQLVWASEDIPNDPKYVLLFLPSFGLRGNPEGLMYSKIETVHKTRQTARSHRIHREACSL